MDIHLLLVNRSTRVSSWQNIYFAKRGAALADGQRPAPAARTKRHERRVNRA